MSNAQEIGRSALNKALALASAHASTAIVAATLIPLAMTAMPTPAEAIQDCTICVNSAVIPNAGPGNTTRYAYDVSTTSSGVVIKEIEIPEVATGAFTLYPNVSGSTEGLPLGWTESEVLTSTLDSPVIKPSGAAAAYIDIADTYGSGAYISSEGSGITFNLFSTTSGSVPAQADIEYNNSVIAVIDPPTPAVATPEPASIATLGTGLAVLARLRRRKRT